MRLFLFFFILHLARLPFVYAATDGTLGTSSTGTSVVSITKVDLVRVVGIADTISFGTFVSIVSQLIYDPVCIYSTSGSYKMTFTSVNGTGTTFRMRSSSNQHITYDVQWNNVNSGVSGTDMNNNVQSSVFTGANTTSTNCGGTNNSRMFIILDPTTFNSAPAGTYSDTLTVLVNPL